MDDYGARMAEARKARGLTQEQMAQMLHVSRQTVSHWENGRALPDVMMAQQIGAVLGFNEDGIRRDGVEPEATVTASADKRSARAAGWIAGCTVLLIGIVCGLLMGAILHQANALQPGQAAIVVTAEADEAPFLVNGMFPEGGWDVGFNFANVSSVPFRPSYLVGRYYAGDEIVAVATVTYEQMLPWMASDMLRQGEPPLRWPFGTNQLYMTHMECILYGTDANGHDLSFSGGVHYQRPPVDDDAENISY